MKKNKLIITAIAVFAWISCVTFKDLNKEQCFSKMTTYQVSAEGSLEEITKPYRGVYECESLYFGGEDKKDIFEYFRLELKSKGELVLSYKLKNGRSEQIPLSYEYNFEEKTIRVYGQWMLIKIDKKFPIKKGKISAAMSLFGKLAVVKFSRP